MIMWTLIITTWNVFNYTTTQGKVYERNTNVHSVPNFKSESACNSAGIKQLKSLSSSESITQTFICVSDYDTDNNKHTK